MGPGSRSRGPLKAILGNLSRVEADQADCSGDKVLHFQLPTSTGPFIANMIQCWVFYFKEMGER